MAPPASFITISSVPFSRVVTQAEFNVANLIWFKYTATVPIVFGMQTDQGGNFTPQTQIYQSDGTTLYGPNNMGNTGWWQALRIVGDYYIKIIRIAGGSSTFDFTFTVDTRPLDVISMAAGDLIINDDANTVPNGFPAIVLSSTGIVKFFVSAIPSGETGAILPNNVSFWHDFYGRLSATNRIAIFDANLAYITSVACGLTGSNKPRFATDVTNNKVYVVNQASQLWTISSTGVATNTGYTLPGVPTFPDVIAVNEDGTKLYWATIYGENGTIHTLNLNTLTPLPDFHTIAGFVNGTDEIAVTPNTQPGDMFVMPNGNVVTWWTTEDPQVFHLIVINSAGTLLYNYDYPYPTMNLDHLAYIHGDSDHIIGWWYTNSGLSIGRYGRLTLATGIIDQDFTHEMFSEGFSSEAFAKFGPSNSCPFVRFQGVSVPPDISGIYFINPTKSTGGGTGKHDSYYDRGPAATPPLPPSPTGGIEKKIPDPTIRTGLFGE